MVVLRRLSGPVMVTKSFPEKICVERVEFVFTPGYFALQTMVARTNDSIGFVLAFLSKSAVRVLCSTYHFEYAGFA